MLRPLPLIHAAAKTSNIAIILIGIQGKAIAYRDRDDINKDASKTRTSYNVLLSEYLSMVYNVENKAREQQRLASLLVKGGTE
ncbi:MAG: hypothetical protein PHT58_00675 [Eubacteriales bacterium]|nr:hypothetical protein [Eubacteriales bacterium]